jgi:hypothetical protein
MSNLRLDTPPIQIYADGQPWPQASPMTLQMGSGAGGLTELQFVVDPVARDKGRTNLAGMQLMDFDQAEIEVVIAGDKGDRTAYCGNVLQTHNTLDGESGDSIKYVARVENCHFGIPLSKAFFWSSQTDSPIGLDLPTVFNPDFDGQVWPNLSQKKHPSGCGLFIHPQSLQSDAAKKYAGSPVPEFWKLWEAVYYICCTLNSGKLSGGLKIANPTPAELIDVLGSDLPVPNPLRNRSLFSF